MTATGRIAEMTNFSQKTVRKWHQRYMENGTSGLKDLPRSGLPKGFSVRFRLEVVAIICQKSPEAFLPGVIHWSIRGLVMVLPRLLILSSISTGIVYNIILQEHHLKLHCIEYYLTKTDSDFFKKAERILDIYQSPPNDGLVLSFDDRTFIQVLERLSLGKPLRPGLPRKNGVPLQKTFYFWFAARIIHP